MALRFLAPSGTEFWKGAASGCYEFSNVNAAADSARRTYTPNFRWRAVSIGTTGWRRHVHHFGDDHRPMQVKQPSITLDPVAVTLTVPVAALDIISASADPGIRILMI